jgi:hypothetical protein
VLTGPPPPPPLPAESTFILHLDRADQEEALLRLSSWVSNEVIPIYGRETTSAAPWCPQWWKHPEAVAALDALRLAWMDLVEMPDEPTGPAVWQRDYLRPALSSLRDPSGPFAGCKPGVHRPKESPAVEQFPQPEGR